ncbi:chitobiase [Vibrio sp. OCN044]|uniref:Chitobiase n=1 Tax=Vibrio tetraodonis subsp. pristinus TaxID=2695891 RepID=A0A6L8LTS8_9VIBR|nr:glycoside hydrolase family 9 protein [Vibrio tetraodonis]MYM59481.1 chitobiase [Vibrio tetraodonis subsp. pristinus]
MQILTNHIGYERLGPKKAILMLDEDSLLPSSQVELIDVDNKQCVGHFPLGQIARVEKWHQGYFSYVNFSTHQVSGSYYLRFLHCQSKPFTISNNQLCQSTLSDLIHYFKSQRCDGLFDRQDRHVRLLNSQTYVDVHGGWYDASGDVSKYLSHLSYANYFNPQQTPIVVWNIVKGIEITQRSLPNFTYQRMLDEALFGADFLLRMQHSSGYFYTTVFDKWSKNPHEREVCSYSTQQGQKSDDYQAGFRQGGGLAIAALAAAARLNRDRDYTAEEYLKAAVLGYAHLKEHNHYYLNDNQENIIDEYCALIASVELYKSTHQTCYLEEAHTWAKRLTIRQQSDANVSHYWSANDDGSRPYFHAAEAGLPAIALCEYLSIDKQDHLNEAVLKTLVQSCQFELSITHKVFNPFGYPRQYVKDLQHDKREAFFIAQDNETGYWWQGENARLSSLAVMAYFAQPYINDITLKNGLIQYAQGAIDWLLGLNPYDICMLDGHGHNNPDYLPQLGFFNAKGGICNGITAGVNEPHGIAFNPSPHKDDMAQNWRWGEQWLPHSAWFLLAIIAQSHHFNNREES